MLKKIYNVCAIAIIILIIFMSLKGAWEQSQAPRELTPKEKRDLIVDEFNSNIDYFKIVQEYMCKQQNNYLVMESYKKDIKDKDVVQAITYIFDDLQYDSIGNVESSDEGELYVVFMKHYPNAIEMGIVYTEGEYKFGFVKDKITEDWYFHRHQYSLMGQR